jgi:hypothetical protein
MDFSELIGDGCDMETNRQGSGLGQVKEDVHSAGGVGILLKLLQVGEDLGKGHVTNAKSADESGLRIKAGCYRHGQRFDSAANQKDSAGRIGCGFLRK